KWDDFTSIIRQRVDKKRFSDIARSRICLWDDFKSISRSTLCRLTAGDAAFPHILGNRPSGARPGGDPLISRRIPSGLNRMNTHPGKVQKRAGRSTQ
ncbi:hypothetical protein KNO81_30250, partial [Paraburkholderia sediminicola]|nr:hypothetical protein [Paraburkholderia sediminicola]